MGKEAVYHHGDVFPYSIQIVSDSDAERIINGALELLQEIGVKFDSHPKALELLSSAGCKVSNDGVVMFPSSLVKESIESSGKSTKVWNRKGTDFYELAPGNTVFSADIGAPNIIDPVTGDRRPSNEKDLANVTRVADSLQNIDAVGLTCGITDQPRNVAEIAEFVTIANNTTKPIYFRCEYTESLEAVIDVAVAIRGSRENLKEKPYFPFWITPMPLHYPDSVVEQLFLAVETGIPIAIGTANIGGISAPVTVAGNLVNGLATFFSGMVLAQLIDRGCLCMDSTLPVFMDAATGEIAGWPEVFLAELTRRQINSMLGFPTQCATAGSTISAQFNEQGIAETSMDMMYFLSNPATYCSGLGGVETGISYSIQSLILCNEIAGMLRRIWKGVQTDDQHLALDVTRDVGFQGSYMLQMHTATFSRKELWRPKYLERGMWEDWIKGGKKDLVDRVDEDLEKIMETHQPEPLPDPVQEDIARIVKKYAEA